MYGDRLIFECVDYLKPNATSFMTLLYSNNIDIGTCNEQPATFFNICYKLTPDQYLMMQMWSHVNSNGDFIMILITILWFTFLKCYCSKSCLRTNVIIGVTL